MAQDQGEYAVGVVLSAIGADGALGVKAIKEHGGVTRARASDSSGPGFSGMPDSAFASGLVDFAIPVDAMASNLIDNLGSFDAFEALLGARAQTTKESGLGVGLSISYELRPIDSSAGGFPARIAAVRLRRHELLEAGHGDDSRAFERRCVA